MVAKRKKKTRKNKKRSKMSVEERFHDAFVKVLAELDDEFTQTELHALLSDALSVKTEAESDELDAIFTAYIADLEQFDCVWREDDENDENSIIKVSTLFKDAQFCVKPTEYEIANGVLVPGHRFTPFCDEQIPPCEVELLFNGDPIPKKRQIGAAGDFIIYHTLLGGEAFLALLSMANDDLMERMPDGLEMDGEVAMEVFDFSHVYHELSFSPGDCFSVRVLDYEDGFFEFKHLPKETLRQSVHLISRWIEDFEEGLDQTNQLYYPPDLTTHIQLAAAFLNGGRFLLENPYLHIGGFLQQNNKGYQIHEFNGESILVTPEDMEEINSLSDIDPDDIYLDEDDFDDEGDALFESGSLEEKLHVMGFDVTEGELEAFMRDELRQGADSIDNVLNRCFDDRWNLFPDLREPFFDQVEALWEQIKSEYNHDDDGVFGELRAEVLKVKEAEMKWLRNLDARDVSLELLHDLGFRELAEMSAPIRALIESLNDIEYNDASDMHIKSTREMIRRYGKILRDLRNNLKTRLNDD